MSHSIFDCVSPLDYRYKDTQVDHFFSENALTRYKLRVEQALIRVLHLRGICAKQHLAEIITACARVTTREVYDEEKRIGHDIRALVNCICAYVSDEAKPFVHMTATSYDVIDTANALRFRDGVKELLLPVLAGLVGKLADIALRESDTVQIGRTHGQHAVPITFGYVVAGYTDRLGNCLLKIQECAGDLCGKFSGAVGAYNALSLLVSDPEEFERDVLREAGWILPAEHSTQIVPPEPMIRLMSEIMVMMGVLANIADDMRHLQRTEISEVGEMFEVDQVGSSTMPQKRNPINFENIKSLWKIAVGRMTTLFMDQISEHQRDLTNSASARTYGEIIAYAVSATKRMSRIMNTLVVDKAAIKRNLELQDGQIAAEPLYIILASLGHPDAHERVRQLTLHCEKNGISLEHAMQGDDELRSYMNKMAESQRRAIQDPSLCYTGIAARKARFIAQGWKNELAQFIP